MKVLKYKEKYGKELRFPNIYMVNIGRLLGQFYKEIKYYISDVVVSFRKESSWRLYIAQFSPLSASLAWLLPTLAMAMADTAAVPRLRGWEVAVVSIQFYYSVDNIFRPFAILETISGFSRIYMRVTDEASLAETS